MYTDNRRRKVIMEIDKDGNFIRFYDSCKMAADEVGQHQTVISQVLVGARKHFKGRYYRYARPSEIEQFKKLQSRSQEIMMAKEVIVEPAETIDIPAETIPAVVVKPEEEMSAFEKMLKRGRNLH